MNPFKTSKKPPKWLMLLILTLISGQTWAFYQAYDMAGQMDTMSVKASQAKLHLSSMKMPQHHNMGGMDMGHHGMSMDGAMDCCQVSIDCQCPPSACSVINVIYFNQDIALSIAPVSDVWSFQNNLYLNKFYSPPYRPPIA